MNNLDFSFEQSPWETFLMSKGMGDTISAAGMLSMLEGEDEQQVEDALNDLEIGCMILDISGLPKTGGSGEAALRLRREAERAQKGLDPSALEESDPLRLYLEEIAATPASGDENLLAASCAKGDERAMEQLTNLGLSRVIQLAGEHTGYGVLLLDLIQEGSLGLWVRRCVPPWKIIGLWMSVSWENWAETPPWKRSLWNCTWVWKRRTPFGKCWRMPGFWQR